MNNECLMFQIVLFISHLFGPLIVQGVKHVSQYIGVAFYFAIKAIEL